MGQGGVRQPPPYSFFPTSADLAPHDEWFSLVHIESNPDAAQNSAEMYVQQSGEASDPTRRREKKMRQKRTRSDQTAVARYACGHRRVPCRAAITTSTSRLR